MASTAYLSRSVDTRLAFFVEHGFPSSRFASEHFGPVVFRDEVDYREELLLLQEFTVDLQLGGLSADGARFRVVNTFRTLTSRVTAVVTSDCVWFDLVARRPRAPPPDLDTMQRSVHHHATFAELPSRIH